MAAQRAPPLLQVGSFDPYSDDPRLGIQKIFLCKYSGYLAVAGTAGQVAGWAGEGSWGGVVDDGDQQGQEPATCLTHILCPVLFQWTEVV